MGKIVEQIKQGEILVSDGAWGTSLQQKGLKPGEMARLVPELLRAGANVIGGCCGTTPEHIWMLREERLKNNLM